MKESETNNVQFNVKLKHTKILLMNKKIVPDVFRIFLLRDDTDFNKKYDKPTKELFPKSFSCIAFIEVKISKKIFSSQHLITNKTERKVNSKVKQL